MIQRKQTLYLLVAAMLSGGLVFLFDLWTTNAGEAIAITSVLNESSFLIQSIFFTYVLSALLSIAAIFLFKNRQLQFVLGRVNMLNNFYLLGVLIYVSLTLSGEAAVSKKGIGMFIPVMVIVLLALANKAIKKDEDLVKSADRLR